MASPRGFPSNGVCGSQARPIPRAGTAGRGGVRTWAGSDREGSVGPDVRAVTFTSWNGRWRCSSASWGSWSCSPELRPGRARVWGGMGPGSCPDSSDPRPNRSSAPRPAHRAGSPVVRKAIEIYQRVIDQYGDKVVKRPKDEPGADTSGDFPLFVNGRRFCHRCIAQLPPEARELYRGRADGLAERWFHEGARRRDMSLLRRVIDQAFCSSWGDDALELAGDLAFQDGRFDEALALYGQLVADRPGDPNILIHPDPSVDLAAVAAKKWLCRAAAGEGPPTKADLEEFAAIAAIRARRPGHRWRGRRGPTPRSWPSRWRRIISSRPANPTAAGRPSPVRPGEPGSSPVRSTSAKRNGESRWRRSCRSADLARASASGSVGDLLRPRTERLLAFHPIVLGDQVLVCDGTRVLAYNLNDRPGDSGWKRRPAGRVRRGSTIPITAQCPASLPPSVGHPALIHSRPSAIGSTRGWAASAPALTRMNRFGTSRWNRDRDQLDRGPRLERRGTHPLGGEVRRIWSSPIAAGGGTRSVQLRGDTHRRCAERLCGRDRPPRRDPHLCGLLRGRVGRPAMDQDTWGPPGRSPTTSWAVQHAHERVGLPRPASITIACSRSTGRCSTT